MKKVNVLITILLITCTNAFSQGNLSGDLMMNVNFFNRDTTINAYNNPLYDNLLSGGESWLSLRYAYSGFTAFLRLDAFHNSNLQNPTQAFSGANIGAYSLSKEFNNLTITGGHIYDQIGSGILFRAYEDRGLLIDNALFGLQLKYKLSNKLAVKGFTGQLKNVFERYKPIIKGINIESDFDLNTEAHITPGIGALNRTLDAGSMDAVVATINTYPKADRFIPKYNQYAITAYNTLNYGNLSWYIEGAYKTQEAIATKTALENRSGNVLYSTIGYAVNKIGVNASFKRTQHFVMRTSPNEVLLKGIYNWQPIIANIRTQRLIARYTPPSQDLSEIAATINGFYSPSDDYSYNLNYTHINTLENTPLYREIFADAEIRKLKNILLHIGVQVLQYNQAVYQQKIEKDYPMLHAITPFAEIVYKLNEKKSIRGELQYMSTQQDYGSWIFGLIEYNIAPKWSFAVSDMYNIKPNTKHVKKAHHYPNAFIAYTHDAHRFTFQYVKQVEGINCTGGVCRYEPAFSGFKLGITSSF